MKIFLKSGIFPFIALVFLLSSCVKDEVTGIKLSKQQINLKLGQTDSLETVVSFSGEMGNTPITISVADSRIVSAQLSDSKRVQSGSTFTQSIVFSSLSPGTTTVYITAGSENMVCTVTVTQATLSMAKSLVINYGVASETIDNGIFSMYLMPSSFTVNDSLSRISGKGQMIHLELLLSPTQTTIPATTFNSSTRDVVNTFQSGYYYTYNGQSRPEGTYIIDLGESGVTYTLVKKGSFTVSINGTSYLIEGDLTTEANEIIHFTYSSPITVRDQSEKPITISPNFTKGELYYYGDVYNANLSETFFAYLETPNVNLSDTTLNGELLIVQFNVYQGSNNYIPSGTYKVITKSAFYDNLMKPLTIIPGYVTYTSAGESYSAGTWYYNRISRRLISAGTVTVTQYLTKYQIEYTLYDRIGSKISGTYNAPLTLKPLRSAESNVHISEPAKGKGFRTQPCIVYENL